MPFHKKYQSKYLATTSLNPNPCNAQKHSDKQIAQLAASIDAFDSLAPFVIDTRLMIVAGSGRWLASKKLGFPEGRLIHVKFTDEKQVVAFVLASNRLSEIFLSSERRI